MSILKKYARPQSEYESEKNRILTVRMPESLYNEWAENCRKHGITMSEGVRILIEEDLHGHSRTEERPISATRPREVPRTQNGKRWTIKPYLVNETHYMCPICKTAQHRTNAARHAKEHGFSSAQEMFESRENTTQ